MKQCIFKTSELRRCIEHAAQSNEFTCGYNFGDEPTNQPQPGFLFVHDRGVYLMSNGNPRDAVEEGKNAAAYVAYAKDCHPERDEDYWENARDLVGGDDFVEYIPFARSVEDELKICDQFEEYVIEVDQKEFYCFYRRRCSGSSQGAATAAPQPASA